MVAMMFIIFLVLLILGVPIAFSLGFSSLFYLFANGIPLTVIAQKFYAGMDSFTCSAFRDYAGRRIDERGRDHKAHPEFL